MNLANLQSFVTAEDNPRIGASADDQKINISAGLVFGVILIVLFAYVISVFTIHSIEKKVLSSELCMHLGDLDVN